MPGCVTTSGIPMLGCCGDVFSHDTGFYSVELSYTYTEAAFSIYPQLFISPNGFAELNPDIFAPLMPQWLEQLSTHPFPPKHSNPVITGRRYVYSKVNVLPQADLGFNPLGPGLQTVDSIIINGSEAYYRRFIGAVTRWEIVFRNYLDNRGTQHRWEIGTLEADNETGTLSQVSQRQQTGNYLLLDIPDITEQDPWILKPSPPPEPAWYRQRRVGALSATPL